MRKRAAAACGAAVVALASGCSTPGPLHLYGVAAGADTIDDQVVATTDTTQPTPSFLTADDRLTGFAYDPFTDHFFLRLAPGNHIRVVDRPARKIKLELAIDADAPGGDLAVNPRSGHMFLVEANRPALLEINRWGQVLGEVMLQGRTEPAAAVAYDMERDELLILAADGRAIARYAPNGAPRATFKLARAVLPSLGCDGQTGRLYAPLADAPGKVGEFDASGNVVRTLPLSQDDRFIDVGPHSFFRMF